jgi:Raf kinase inhibitor-like YbhB/YbcL family protein
MLRSRGPISCLVLSLCVIFLALVAGCTSEPSASPAATVAAVPTPVPSKSTSELPPAPPATAAPTVVPVSPTLVPPTPVPHLTLVSSAFSHEGEMPLRFAQRTFNTPEGWPVYCPGENVSPPLSWSNVPPGTVSFALTMYDHIALCEKCSEQASEGQIWPHWGVYNIPAATTSLPEGLSAGSVLPDGSVQVVNGYNEVGYGGPCPPLDHEHFYVLTLYALDAQLDLPERAVVDDLSAALEGHVLEQAELVGTFLGR